MKYPTTNKKLIAWVELVAKVTTPDRIHWCDGSEAEYDKLCKGLVKAGTFRRLNPKKRSQQLLRSLGPDVTLLASKTARTSALRRDRRWSHEQLV